MIAVAAGDEVALRRLYDRHAAAVIRLLRRLTSASTDDLLQETWLAVWQSAASYRGESSVRGWVLGVARNQAHNRLRRRQLVTVDLEEAVDVADRADPVEAQALASVAHESLLGAVRELPLPYREVVALGLVEGLPYGEISQILGIPVGTVKSRMSAARSRLVADLEERGLCR